MSGHIYKTWFASQAKLSQQKNGRQKKWRLTRLWSSFSARHFSASRSGAVFLPMCPDIREMRPIVCFVR
jgi:hypothetical protein